MATPPLRASPFSTWAADGSTETIPDSHSTVEQTEISRREAQTLVPAVVKRTAAARTSYRSQKLYSDRVAAASRPMTIVVGPSTLIVNADIIFDDALDVPQVEAAIVDASTALRANWAAVAYVYLNPVAGVRSRRGDAVPAPPGHIRLAV